MIRTGLLKWPEAARLRRLSAAAVVLLTGLIMVSQPALAQPDPQAGSLVRASSVGVAYEMTEMCVGQQQEFSVTVNSGAQVARGGKRFNAAQPMAGIRVDAGVMNASLGAFQPASATTGIQPGSGLSSSSRATFVFKAVKKGTTNVYFEVQVMDGSGKSPWLAGPIKLTINDCEPKLLVRLDGEMNDATYHGNMGPVTLSLNDNGDFNEAGALQWTETAHNPECSSLWSVPGLLSTSAEITGKVSDTTIDVTINFQSMTHGVCGVCEGTSLCIQGGDEFGEISASFPADGGPVMMQQVGHFLIILERKTPPQGVGAVPSEEENAVSWRSHTQPGGAI